MIKKITFLLLPLLLIIGGNLSAQSLRDNPDYNRSVQLKKQSEAAFDEGDYDLARQLAEESRHYAELADEYVQKKLLQYRANSYIVLTKDRIQTASLWQAEKNFPAEFAEGKSLYNTAIEQYKTEDYEESINSSKQALEVMKVIHYIGSGTAPAAEPEKTVSKPLYYTVRLLPGNADCLWNIAGYSFIYGDPTLWRLIYEKNKSSMPDPNNPDLILPGMKLEIPSLTGESRSGTWNE